MITLTDLHPLIEALLVVFQVEDVLQVYEFFHLGLHVEDL